MSSDFVTVLDGVLAYNDEAWEMKKKLPEVKAEIDRLGEFRARKAGAILLTSQDGYYNHDRCIKDFEKAIGKMHLKYNNFSVTQILREINFVDLQGT